MSWIDDVVREVAELDYNSPEGQPDVMLVTGVELRQILVGHAPEMHEGWTLNQAGNDVMTERLRQIEAEGWTPEHDDEHTFGELVQAAADLCVDGTDFRVVDMDGERMIGWGLTERHKDDRRRQLVIAGALILAEIERLDRQQPNTNSGTNPSHITGKT